MNGMRHTLSILKTYGIPRCENTIGGPLLHLGPDPGNGARSEPDGCGEVSISNQTVKTGLRETCNGFHVGKTKEGHILQIGEVFLCPY